MYSNYSRSIAWLAFCSSFYSMINLYISGSFLGLFIGLSLHVIIIYIINYEKRMKSKQLSTNINQKLHRLIFSSLSFIYFISSMHGVYLISMSLPINDRSVLFVPYVIFSFFFGGVSIGLFQFTK